jgi:hypothetical protein
MSANYQDIERPKKRASQDHLTWQLAKQLIRCPDLRGSILILSGPSPLEAVSAYKKYDISDDIILIEDNVLQWWRAVKKLKLTSEEKKQGITLVGDDFYNYIEEKTPEELRGIDLDLCTTMNNEVHRQIIWLLSFLHKEKILPFWLRVTTCCRALKKEIRLSREAVVTQVAQRLWDDHKVIINRDLYQDWHGSAMSVMQIICLPNTQQEREMKTYKTYKQLNTKQQAIADALVGRLWSKGWKKAGYTENDISKLLKLSRNSISAIKAHYTMGNK